MYVDLVVEKCYKNFGSDFKTIRILSFAFPYIYIYLTLYKREDFCDVSCNYLYTKYVTNYSQTTLITEQKWKHKINNSRKYIFKDIALLYIKFQILNL